MSEESEYPEEQREARNEAREQAIIAGQRLWDSYAVVDDDYGGAIVTGYVVIVEAVLPNGYTSVAWMGGNGQPPGSQGLTGLASHRVDGLCRHVIREIYDDNVSCE